MKKKNQGITLIALIITIIVMLILVSVTISIAINGGLFEKAGEATGKTKNAIKEEQELANGKIEIDGIVYDSIDDYVEGRPGSSVKNKYDKDGWDLAYVCNNGVWENDPIEKGGKAEGDVIAKFYKTGSKITPAQIFMGSEEDSITLDEGPEYHLVIEGQGPMGAMVDKSGGAKAWQKDMVDSMNTGIIAYVTEIRVCDGITEVGHLAFAADTSLTKVFIGKDVTKIGIRSFYQCNSLTNIVIPDGVTDMEGETFSLCQSLTSVTIPNSVENIGNGAFEGCDCLTELTIPSNLPKRLVDLCGFESSVKHVTFQKGSSRIAANDLFRFMNNLESVTIPKSITNLEPHCFDYIISNLKSITYQGTKAEWNSITKGEEWSVIPVVIPIVCTDGTITL